MELQQPEDQIDAEEWWTSKEILDEVAVGGDGAGAVQLVADDLDVHVQGDVAWVEGRGRFINRSGAERQIRAVSMSFAETRNGWLLSV